ncbi:hypothetical protein ACX8Z9_11025 [Arthrobacter halodurans]|uniref:Uncharacterized protein n=1 Tax=Arthrobacter halodurans TaxID=516699 RepID=A0ABV4UP27_9MICC
MNGTAHGKWFDEFVLELRLRDVPGDAIGDAAASVREFVADSGQAPAEAFGPARDYAASLDLPRKAGPALDAAAVAGSVVGLLAFLVLVSTFVPLARGEQLHFSGPQVLLLLVPVAAAAALPAYLNALLRNRWVLAGVLSVAAAAGVLSSVVAPGPGDSAWLSLPSATVAAMAGAVLLATAVSGTVATLRDAGDPLVDPMTGPTPGRGATALAVAGHWVLPVGAVFFWFIALALR